MRSNGWGDSSDLCARRTIPGVWSLRQEARSNILGAGRCPAGFVPLLLVIAGLVELDSPGSVLYCAQRVVEKRQAFSSCSEFRTMVRNADDLKLRLRHNNDRAGPFFKM